MEIRFRNAAAVRSEVVMTAEAAMTGPDVIIAGAGPAGSSLAIHLARQGRSVVLFDRVLFPREKACGEGIMPAGVAALRRLGVEIEGFRFRGVRYHHAGRTVTGAFPDGGRGLAVRRLELDARLLDAARSHSNVAVRTGEAVEAPVIRGGAVCGVRTAANEYRAPLIVGADGANSVLRHKLGWDATPRRRRFGTRRHFRSAREAEPWVDVHLSRGTETYVTPLPNNELLVATLGASGKLPPAFAHLEPIDDPLGAAPLTVRASRRFTSGFVLLGDAAGSCDPITGGGISQALLSAELLASHLAGSFPPTEEVLAEFDRARERMLRGYRCLTAGVLTLASHSWLAGAALSLLDRSPGTFSRLLALAGGAA